MFPRSVIAKDFHVTDIYWQTRLQVSVFVILCVSLIFMVLVKRGIQGTTFNSFMPFEAGRVPANIVVWPAIAFL